jgi:aquaporin Z
MADSTTKQKLAAEVLGTFVLVFFGCGAALISGGDYVATALGFGLAVLVMVYAVGRVSGGHFNPAISVGAGMSGRLAWPQVGTYVAAQLVGAIVAGGVLLALMNGFATYDVSKSGLAQNSFGDQGSGYAWWAAFLLEALMTAVFLLVILAVTDERNEHPALAPLTIGLSLTMIHLASIGATGTSVNPARSIGVGLFAGSDAILQLWLFILAPLLGGAIAGLAYPMIFGRVGESVPGSGFRFSRPRTAAQVPGYAAPDQYQQQWNQEQPAPIIQDGWQWDPAGQQWHPVGSTPEQWQAQQAAEQAAARQSAAPAVDESYTEPIAVRPPVEGDLGDDGDGGTQIRPPG